jgi:cytochrome c-type biogenesis protein CcmH/NrfG
LLGKDESLGLNAATKIQLADYIESYFHRPALAESLVQEIVKGDPNSSEATMWLSGFYARQGNFARGIELLQQWLTRKPEDQQAKSQLEQMKMLAQADSAANAGRSAGSPPDTASKK